ncbi:NAD-dependent protein deacetylase [Corynebacterium sp. p3-SID1145]|uniref:Sir2 family NAD-dependent protein deacetylase n=1 Tax=unclassified Corynebacterium TaxID=2624378 RepID=UPI0021AA183F|nr:MULTISPECIES: Sir2 family NAD-dependent protein deacetylase [unclassified Corynebacterium]MCT1451733.1 NAD-dependent protein deacetylase [Corynebacterium sp. p3-SID1145]MCT1460830.1 NAD-dependent protein deacetylase [Corynebacterium sp. p3-SID1140]
MAFPEPEFTDPAVELAHRSAIRSIERVVHETAEPTPPEQALAYIVGLLRNGPALVITGAGVSTESGIPDYRSPGGRLSKGRPMTYQEFSHSPSAVRRYWARAFVGIRQMRATSPNRAHYALVELERAGLISGIITQNVDGLHLAAGSRNVIALHGDMEHVVCLDCGARENRTLFDARFDAANPGYLQTVLVDESMINPDGDVELPEEAVQAFTMVKCAQCGGWRMKPDVVYFGENVPRGRREAAGKWLEASTSLIAVGTSLAVMSGYRLVLDARAAGKPVAVINGGPGRADTKAAALWRTGVGEALDAVLDALEL